MIGAAVGDKDGNRTDQVLHVLLPRSDYDIDPTAGMSSACAAPGPRI